MTKRLLAGAVFLVGCAVGGASSQLVVPKASAQQAASLPNWEVRCVWWSKAPGEEAPDQMGNVGTRFGREGWEPSLVNNDVMCFKRPKM